MKSARVKFTVAAVVVIVGALLLACLGFSPPIVLLFGWMYFLIHTLPQTTIEPAALAVAATALVLLIGVVHWLACWLYGRRPVASAAGAELRDASSPAVDAPAQTVRTWRLRWTFAVVFLVVFLFAAGIALIVTVHETGWLLASPEPWFTIGGEAFPRVQSQDNLKNIGYAFGNYHDKLSRFPNGGMMNEYGELLHSWETQLLPYLEDRTLPNLDLPWNHPENATFFRREKEVFLNLGVLRGRPDRVGTVVDADGYGLSHYAANSRVLGVNSAVRREDVTDGTSNTILAGEVSANFKPWGHPVNWRDPAAGVHQSPDGFGGPWSSGLTQFLMLDGSVQTVTANTDPAVLKALATPAGGEKLPGSEGMP
jgi:hypothetical protein